MILPNEYYFVSLLSKGVSMRRQQKSCRFNGKELDEETGLYYFGARYYNPKYVLWYGTDPLQEKYPWVSSYCYTMGNPVIYYDEDGRIPFTSSVKYTRISSRFGRRFHPIQKRWKVHGGIDLAAPKGSEVHSLADGKVKKIGWDPKGYGRYVIIQHDEGYESLYAHLEKDGVLLKQNDVVKENDIIAYSGNTGGSTAPHLHIEIGKGDILQNKNKINPESIEDLQQYLQPVINGGLLQGVIIYENRRIKPSLFVVDEKMKPIKNIGNINVEYNE